MYEEIKNRLNSGNTCCCSVQSLLPSHLLSRNVKVKIYKTIIMPVVFYGWEMWCVTLREEHRLRVFENRVLRGIFGPERDQVTGEWRKLYSGELHKCTHHQISLRRLNQGEEVGWACGMHGRGEKIVHNFKGVDGKPEGMRPFGRPRYR
jgi:hypothetical protein